MREDAKSPPPRCPRCYQCDLPAAWLAPDGRCGECTRYTPEEISGEFDQMQGRKA